MKLRKVLILHKKSTYQIQALEHRESRFIKLLEEGSEVVTRVKIAHDEHVETLELLEKELLKRGVEYRSVARAELTQKVTDVDLVISVGGDGTFLDASHSVDSIPVLGINSSSSSSFGHFCLGNQKNLKEVLAQVEDGELTTRPILRLELWLNGSLLPELVLNEVLVGHSNPAATTRLFMEFGEEREEQRSSGVWIGTPGGSTGSLRSAGGEVLPITDNRYLYIVREPCMRPGENYKFLKGILDHSQEIRIVSQMRTGVLHIDGQHIDYQFGLGDELIVKGSPHYLRAYIADDVNARFI
ncbi:MAG: NAD(+)/NADH kinase [Cyanobacteria bacterium SZAS-4]|nr:NAD(+)/NADH kinase [Cyanobacteria bacterium SZAS-4]